MITKEVIGSATEILELLEKKGLGGYDIILICKTAAAIESEIMGAQLLLANLKFMTEKIHNS